MKCCFDSFTDKELFLKVISVREDYIRESGDEDCYFLIRSGNYYHQLLV